MKKLFIFLILFLGINICTLPNVSAASFYEGDYIDGIWVTKAKGGTKFYQKARFFNRSSDGKFAYCIEPFASFNGSSTYSESNSPVVINAEQAKKIEQIAYFGYQYPGHEAVKWYAITQFMIWQVADPSSSVYFTDSLNGNRITAYTSEINEIYSLINNYNSMPNLNNMHVYLVEGKSVTLHDPVGTLKYYKSNDSHLSITNDNRITISNLDEGDYTFTLSRNENRAGNIPIYFHADSSQDLMIVGNLSQKMKINVHVKKTSLEITKIDADTETTTPTGDASLSGAIYQLYDRNMNELDTLEIGEDMTAKLENLDFGYYYLKEIAPGKGYTLDEEIYEFHINQNNTDVALELKNKVIEKEIIIHKAYGDGFNSNNEGNITFNIYDSKNNLYKTITTDNNGYAKVLLPFGVYRFSQVNTTDGYKSVNDFTVNVEDDEIKEINLYDYKIKVPNTSKDNSSLILLILSIIGGIYVQALIFY